VEVGTLLSPYKLSIYIYPASPKYFSVFRYTTRGQVDGDLYYKAMINGIPMFKDVQLYKETSYDSPGVVYYAI
jgi:hypothetical protein